jgi:hypothetical protein
VIFGKPSAVNCCTPRGVSFSRSAIAEIPTTRGAGFRGRDLAVRLSVFLALRFSLKRNRNRFFFF